MITLHDTQIPTLNEEFKIEQFDNEVLLYSVSKTQAVYLNQTALLVYGLCSSGSSIGEIIASLEDAYPDHKESIRIDVTASLQQLIELGALRLSA
jgi:hypothetical protein